LWRKEVSDEVRRFLALPPVTNIGNSDFHHPSPEPDVEETMCLSSKHPTAVNKMGTIDPIFNLVASITLGYG